MFRELKLPPLVVMLGTTLSPQLRWLTDLVALKIKSRVRWPRIKLEDIVR